MYKESGRNIASPLNCHRNHGLTGSGIGHAMQVLRNPEHSFFSDAVSELMDVRQPPITGHGSPSFDSPSKLASQCMFVDDSRSFTRGMVCTPSYQQIGHASGHECHVSYCIILHYCVSSFTIFTGKTLRSRQREAAHLVSEVLAHCFSGLVDAYGRGPLQSAGIVSGSSLCSRFFVFCIFLHSLCRHFSYSSILISHL